MNSESSGGAKRRRRVTAELKRSLREMGNQLSLLNRHVGARVRLKDVDLDCLELINRHDGITPSVLARHTGLHPATVTGVLDRLESGGWVTRERAVTPTDRRAVTVRALRERNSELARLYSGMSAAMDDLCADYTEAELELIAGFIHQVTHAGEHAADDIASDERRDAQ
ncbi:MarR family transcriptional regulator [Spiractinospora alimapuensis]|uniref:MarR family transcriptional regulator n=1 Tax=Spiractinospora alimapuensis TaxID=2820884 RepID=UPI001F334B63|nr:MarR family transcriptional regulator [Spiractinospora alimapuensis]QVQ51574.1 MarR family transcriptional regulator [Spiractinospora alimapuensis]